LRIYWAWFVNKAPGPIRVGRADDQPLRCEVYASQRLAHKKNELRLVRFNPLTCLFGHQFSQNGTALGFLPQRQRREMQNSL
jgi:hypothetical protein